MSKKFDIFCFYTLWRKFIGRHKIIKTKELIYRLLRSAVLCESPCGEQRGKALSEASISERSSQFSTKEGAQIVFLLFLYIFVQKIYLIWITFYNFVRLLHKR